MISVMDAALPQTELAAPAAATTQDQSHQLISSRKSKGYRLLLGINYACLFVGSVSSTLLSKYYFNHMGSSRWVSTWVQSAGFPLLLPIIYIPPYLFNNTRRRPPFSGFTPRLFALSLIIGLLLGINNLLFSWGNSYLPVSTSSLLLSSQLAFNLILSTLIVKTKITYQNLNCVVLLTLTSVLLALTSSSSSSSHDKSYYFMGFFSTIAAGFLFALYLPVMEMVYNKQVNCYTMVVEMQLLMEAAATALATVGLVAAGSGFSEMRRESNEAFDVGPRAYWWTVAANVVAWQLCFMGTAGMVFLTTSVTGGICMTALMAVNVLGGVVVYGDEFGGVKVVSTLLCVWGFSSYVYGIYEREKKAKVNNDGQLMEITQVVTARV